MVAQWSSVGIDDDMLSEAHGSANQGENIQHVQEETGEEVEASCVYCGGALHDCTGELKGLYMRVGGQSSTGTPSMLSRRACACPLHVGACGTPCEQA